jgi:lysozyme family protein
MDGVIDKEDLKRITVEDYKRILKTIYWDKCGADQINNQSVAEIFVDWAYLSGSIAKKTVQKIVGVPQDGVIGPLTIDRINYHDQVALFKAIKEARLQHIFRIVMKNHTQKRFQKGWLNRIASFVYHG